MALSSKQVAYLAAVAKANGGGSPKTSSTKAPGSAATSVEEEMPKIPKRKIPKGMKGPAQQTKMPSEKTSKAKPMGKLSFKVKSIADIKKARQNLKGEY